jgi:hypothetical protein
MSRGAPRRRVVLLCAIVAAVAGATLWLAVGSGGAADNLPADKVTTTGSRVQRAAPGSNVTLLGPVRMRTSTVEDLVLQVSAECSILTELTTNGNDSQDAMGQVRVWVEVDGRAVGVVPNKPGASDDGKVVFCSRAHHRDTSGFVADGNATIHDYLRTRDANAFNWATVNVGNGIHTIVVKGELTRTATNKGVAEAVVGNRTLVVQPTTYMQVQPTP